MIQHPSQILAFGRKIFHLDNRSLLLLSAPGSLSLSQLLEALLAETPLKALVLPLLVAAVSLTMYFVVFVLDFISGVKASRHEAEVKWRRGGGRSERQMAALGEDGSGPVLRMDGSRCVLKSDGSRPVPYFSSAKGWSSIWKISTVSILVIWSSFFSMLAALSGMEYLPSFFMLASGTIAIMATLLDIYSIGENQKRLTGKKARIFEWLEEVRKLMNAKFKFRIQNDGL